MGLTEYLDGQYRRPIGTVGRWIGWRMARDHRPENGWTVGLLDPGPDERILEIGFGPGVAVAALARRVTRGLVAGVDFSAAMVRAARRRNRREIAAGRVDLREGDVAALPFPDGMFDQVFGIHTLYFWPDPSAALAEVYRVLKPGGRLVLTVLPKEQWAPDPASGARGTPSCIPYSGRELAWLLLAAGFRTPRLVRDPLARSASNFAVTALR